MNYEQKYKEALNKAQIYRNHLIETGDNTNEIEYIFPELINEDEKIRRAIYKTIKYLETELSWDFLYDISISDAIAWLKKQKR